MATNHQQTVGETNRSAQPAKEETYNNNSPTTTGKDKPGALPDDGWLALLGRLRTERRRVLKGLDKICRLTFIAVHTDFQRQGIGSMTLKRICNETWALGICAGGT